MKRVKEIEEKIKDIDWFINSHNKQVGFYTQDEFDAVKAVEYLTKIKELQAEKSILEWVLGEGQHFDDVATVGNADVSEWQPDWSQAPDGFNWFVKQVDDSTHFLKTKPDLCQDYWRTDTCVEWIHADIPCPLRWRSSLRKRPTTEKITEWAITRVPTRLVIKADE